MRAVLLLLIAFSFSGHLCAQKINFGKKTRITRFDKDNKKMADQNSLLEQKVNVDQLIEMLDWDHRHIDTTMKRKGYLLMQKDVDSASSLYQYSVTEHKEDNGPTTIRSFAYMDATVGQMQGRMINYRTYDKDEFSEISGYMLSHNYQRTNQFEMGNAKHSVYTNGTQTIRLKVITTKLKTKQTFTSYELELGK
jgi:hypothetical protein